ncbi:hypothetical protein IGI04_032118 [Brassica rapa subsp. trilocularis]|nr:hypothetical protein IGI04_032118 [Brassica rapa subsp. trilocularis]
MQIFVKTLTGKMIILEVESFNNKRYKIKHRHKKVKLAVYKVDGTGKVQRLRKECPSVSCGPGTFMASHFDRHYCGKCGTTYVFKERLLLVVCNYVYYHSLRFAEQKGHKSLFVHVPLFSKISEDTQMQFVPSHMIDTLQGQHKRIIFFYLPDLMGPSFLKNKLTTKRHMMDKLFILSLIGILMVTAYGVAAKMVYTDLDILEKLENFDIPEDDADDYDTKLFDWPSFTSRSSGKNLVNVDTFGAAGDGISDDTQAFVSAWNKACGMPKSVLLVPQGRTYLVNATKFNGPCETKLVIQIDGKIVAPDEPSNWDPKFQRIWLEFSKLKGVVFQGNGVIDGSGSKWWAASCKKNKSNPCKSAPTALTIESSSGVKVTGLTIQNSQQMNFIIARSNSVRVSKVMVSSPGDSPNTDGIHITGSTNVVLQDCKIGTGDDCVSIVNASSNIKMKKIYCGPGHGISIGSLGNNNSTGIVTNVVLDTAFLKETTNGLRIKTYQGGSGYVQDVRFTNVQMQDVSNPILIDQFYCDNPTSCQNQTSAVKISQIMYRNITGTTKSEKAIKFACSDTVPCSHIVLNNVNLEGRDGQVEAYCNSAEGFGYGVIHPSADCLYSHDNKGLDQSHKSEPETVTEEAETGHDEL